MPNKFYAVRKGHNVGILNSFKEFKRSIKGYSNYEAKAFNSMEAAREYMKGENRHITAFETQQEQSINYDYIAYTDGSCKNNKKIGGFAAIIIDKTGRHITAQGSIPCLSSYSAEFFAIIAALRQLPKGSSIIVYSDCDAIVQSYRKLDALNWNTEELFTTAYPEYWAFLYALLVRQRIQMRLEWIRGHADNLYNILCDRIANREALKMMLVQYE